MQSGTADPQDGQAVRAGVRLAVDVGSVRIGVARSDPGGVLASPLTVVRSGPGDLDALATLAASAEAIEVIVGLPISLSGREGAAAAAARASPRSWPGGSRPSRCGWSTSGSPPPRPMRRCAAAGRTPAPAAGRRRAAAAVLLQAALDAERATGLPPGQCVPSWRGHGRGSGRMTDNGSNWPPG